METPPDTVHPPAPEEVNVENDQTPDPFISGVNDSRHKAWLMDFKQAFSDTDQFYLTELDDCFEIVVSHKSANGYTGGAEAYRMDKESGKVLMLWHEHPMRLPEVEEHLESP